MAEIQPLRALRYEPRAVGSLDAVVAPPYDVIDDRLRAELAGRSPFNVVEVDLPRQPGGDPYLHAQTTMELWRQEGIVTSEREPALWAMTQEYAVPGEDRTATRHGFFCRARVDDYGEGRIRPHERTQPGPKEDRLLLTRATRANLSPIFSLFPDSEGAAWSTLEPATREEPFAAVTDIGGTVNRLWRVADPASVRAVQDVLGRAELLIADGHHRYETARIYAEEVGGEGEHRYVLMFLCSLSDPGLTILPTHRLLSGLDERGQLAIRDLLLGSFQVEEISDEELEPPAATPGVAFGYIDSFHKKPYRVTLAEQRTADEALADRPEAYRRLDAAVLEALVLRGALGMSETDIAERRGLAYAKDTADAREAIGSGRCDAAFFMRPTPIEHVRAVAAEGESMPPKSTYFFPKVPTGLLFSPLE